MPKSIRMPKIPIGWAVDFIETFKSRYPSALQLAIKSVLPFDIFELLAVDITVAMSEPSPP